MCSSNSCVSVSRDYPTSESRVSFLVAPFAVLATSLAFLTAPFLMKSLIFESEIASSFANDFFISILTVSSFSRYS